MRRWMFVVIAAGCGPAQKAAVPPPRGDLVFQHVRVFDGAQVVPDATVIVDGDRIAAVGAELSPPAGAQVIDGHGKTLLPGLIDAHVHVHDGGVLEQSLAFGVTTVLDMFAAPSVFALRQEPRADRADLRSAGICATAPGGHGTEYGLKIPTLQTPGEAQAWVDARIAEGSDYIKIIFDGGSAYHMVMPTLDTPTFTAIVDAAHARHKLAVVHVGDYDLARAAIDHGADGLAHLFRDQLPPPDFGRDVAAHHAFVVPTLAVIQNAYGGASRLPDDPEVMAMLPPVAAATLRAHRAHGLAGVEPNQAIAELRDAGATILAGTDAPNRGTAFGASLHEELALLVAAGLSPTAALPAATSAPATRFGLADRGRIAAGQRADLLLVEGDPTADIAATRHIAGVWHLGKRFDRDAYRQRIAAATVATQAQPLDAISDFEVDLTAHIGQPWRAHLPQRATIARVAGLHGSGALEIHGVVPSTGLRGTGAVWLPGLDAWLPADLSARSGLSFVARGDGQPYHVVVFTQHDDRKPHLRPFIAGSEATSVHLTWHDFDTDGSDVVAVLIGRVDPPGPFSLVIDDVTLE